ncbi:PadR family transcriptional regulator [Nocardioides sp. MAHUQ-72]|uniref:PadR family transcriptional regulator n=1 Tax=unclassified Nocardioides TaxID=2615069 RepID=UPI0036155B17
MGSRGSWGGGPWGAASWGGPWHGGHTAGRGRPGPPPWLAGMFGLAQGDQQPGPRVRRGDVRSAILDVLSTEPMNGYQVMSQIAERSGGAWRPSPGSVYPTIQQLEDEGLVEAVEGHGQRKLKPTAAGWTYIDSHREELAAVWAPFDRAEEEPRPGFADLKPEIGQVMSAVWQIVTQGTDRQRREAVTILVETRRRLYGVLAEGDPGDGDPAEEES